MILSARQSWFYLRIMPQLFLILTGIMVNRRYEIKKEVKFGA